jgi:hypothetical protein
MLVHGAAADRLVDVPMESDPISSLLRIAAQTGTRRIHLAPAILDSGDLILVDDAQALARAEKRWLERSAGRIGWRKPASAAVGAVVRWLAPRFLARARSALFADIAGTLLAAGAAALAWTERPAAGLAVLALAAGGYLCGRLLRGFERGSMPATAAARWGDAVVDVLFVASAVAAEPRNPGFALFAALVAVVAARLAEAHGPNAPIATAGDRILRLGAFALAAALGNLLPAVQVFAVAVLGLDLVLRSTVRLTPA